MADENTHEIDETLRARARMVTDPAGREVRILADADGQAIADQYRLGLHAVYRRCMSLGICPHRYLRNRDTVSTEEQLRLASSTVAVIGAGGLGGHVIHLLARIGVGRLIVVDCDCFDETNLNRQIFCTTDSIGKPKAHIAAVWVQAINPGVEVSAHWARMEEANLPQLLAGAAVVVDGLDNIRDRLVLEKGARRMRVPLVHGALAGLDGQVMTVYPDDRGLTAIYGERAGDRRDPGSPEAVLGVPPLMPSVIATFQCMEVVKILLDREGVLRNTMIHISIGTGELNRFKFE